MTFNLSILENHGSSSDEKYSFSFSSSQHEEGHLDDDENDDDDDENDDDDGMDDDDDDDECLAHEAGHREPAQLFVKLLRSALDMQTLDMHAHIQHWTCLNS